MVKYGKGRKKEGEEGGGPKRGEEGRKVRRGRGEGEEKGEEKGRRGVGKVSPGKYGIGRYQVRGWG